MSVMAGRPAGFSDDDSDDDFDFASHYRPVPLRNTTNGGSISLEQTILNHDTESLIKLIEIAKRKNVTLNDASTRLPPLLMACSVCWIEGLRLLLESGADPNVGREDLMTPLLSCCSLGGQGNDFERSECVKILLEHNANPNLRDCRGRVALMLSAENEFVQVLNKILECSVVDLTAVDPQGWTALFYAFKSGNQVVVDRLVAAGIDPNAKDKEGRKAIDFQRQLPEQPEDTVKVADLFKDSDQLIPSVTISDVDDEANIKSFFQLLPDENGSGGFGESVRNCLDEFNCVSVANAQLCDVLLGDEQSLIRLGVKFSFARRKIIQAVRQFHCRNWEVSSSCSVEGNVKLEDVGNSISSLLRDLCIMNSSVEYLQRNIDRQPEMDCNYRKSTVDILLRLHSSQLILRRRIEQFLQELKKVKTLEMAPRDFVGKSRATKANSFLYKAFSAAIAISVATCIYFFIKT